MNNKAGWPGLHWFFRPHFWYFECVFNYLIFRVLSSHFVVKICEVTIFFSAFGRTSLPTLGSGSTFRQPIALTRCI